MKIAKFPFALLIFSFALHADPPATQNRFISFGESGPEQNTGQGVTGLFGPINHIEKRSDAAGNPVYLVDGKIADPKTYPITLWDGTKLNLADALTIPKAGSSNNLYFGGSNAYIVSQQEADRSAPTHVLIEKVQGTIYGLNKEEYYLVLDEKGSHWLAKSDLAKTHSTYVASAPLAGIIKNEKLVPKDAHVVISGPTLDQLVYQEHGLKDLSSIVDSLSERQSSVEDLQRIRDVTLKPDLFAHASQNAKWLSGEIRNFIDKTVSDSIKRAAPVASDVRPDEVISEVKSEIIR